MQAEMLKRAQEGESSAFERLVDHCRSELERYIQSRIGETYARAWESIAQLTWTGNATFIHGGRVRRPAELDG